jgi:hypothetical protein
MTSGDTSILERAMPRLIRIGVILAGLVVLPVGGALFAVRIWPGVAIDLAPVPPTSIPADFPLLALWTDAGDTRCRAFFHDELTHARTHLATLSLSIAAADEKVCTAAFAELASNGRWTEDFPWARQPWRLASFSIERRSGAHDRISLSYSDDDDRINRSTYATDGLQILTPLHGQAYGPARAISLLTGGAGAGLALWLISLIVLRRKRR